MASCINFVVLLFMESSCFSDRVYIYIQVDTPTMVNLQTLFFAIFSLPNYVILFNLIVLH